MKLIPIVVTSVSLAGGWCWIATVTKGGEALPIKLDPVVHTPYDPAAIGNAISFHESRVERDPRGAIGWSMLSEAWLARSRESDSDTAAWKAEEAARKSLKLRTRGNGRAFQALVASLLEQHRFQDAKKALEDAGNRTRVYADVLVELGELEKASSILRGLDASRDPSVVATMARVTAEKGDHAESVQMFRRVRKALEGNPAVSDQTLAWLEVKLGGEEFKAGRSAMAKKSYEQALRLYPRSYKAALGLAHVAASEGDWTLAVKYAEQTLVVAKSLEAVAILGDARRAAGDLKGAHRRYEQCLDMYLDECQSFARAGKGGTFQVRPIDRQFATFCAQHRLYVGYALPAARRDLQNRPDRMAVQNLVALTGLARANS